jgi:hypothetical protein
MSGKPKNTAPRNVHVPELRRDVAGSVTPAGRGAVKAIGGALSLLPEQEEPASGGEAAG